MPNVPLPTGIQGERDIPKTRELLVNMYNSGKNQLLKTPGQTSFSTGEGACRGELRFQDHVYQVSGQKLIQINSAGTVSVIGDIAGTETCILAKNFTALVIVVKGGNGYVYTPSGGLVPYTTNYKPSVDVDSINQRFVFVPEDGSPLFYTDPLNPLVIPALNFFDAELLPDENTGCINLRNDFYVGGEESFEIFRDTGPTNAPFQRVDGAAVETGYVAGRARYKDTFVFLGRDRGGAYSFHIMGAGDAPKISTDFIDEILNLDYTEEELKACISQRFTWNKIDMVAFRLERETFLFFGSGWCYIQTGINADDVITPWDVGYVTFAFGRYITGSVSSTKIGKLADVVTEFGEKIERQIETFIDADPDTYFVIDSIFLKCITGTSTPAGVIELQISRDNLKWGPRVPRTLGETGKTEQQLVWYGGGGRFESYCGIRLRTTADVNFSLDGLMVNGE